MSSSIRLFFFAIVLLLPGYLGIKAFYDGLFTVPGASTQTMTPALFLLVVFSYFTGAGGNAVSKSLYVDRVTASSSRF
jgi:hypothetical protein